MPSTSKKQEKFMRAIGHGWKPSRMKNPPSRAVGREFMKADEKAKGYFAGGNVGGFLPQLSLSNLLQGLDPSVLAQLTGYSPGESQEIPGGTPEEIAPPEQGGLIPPPIYPEPTEMRRDSSFRQQLRGHKSRISDILGRGDDVGAAHGGYMQQGGLAAMRGKQVGLGGPGRVAPGGPGQMPGRGRFMQRPPGGGRRMPPGMQRQMMMRGRGAPGGRMPGGRGGRPSPAPSGPPGAGGAPSVSPSDARMSGGQAMPYRGLMQKMQAARRGGGAPTKQIGMGDQQGGLARAMQTQTGRPPISRRAAFPGSRTNQY